MKTVNWKNVSQRSQSVEYFEIYFQVSNVYVSKNRINLNAEDRRRTLLNYR